ncbi:MAG: M1 family aminopeptidase [Flavobacteriales bacterium]
MKKSVLILFSLIISVQCVWAQSYNPLLPPNTYRNADNPNYWKNKMPFPGYWQQDVHYTMKANVDERTDIVTATMQLEYWNNSPDTLYFVFFHLYQNAFQPKSYCHMLHEANKYPIVYGRYESQGLGTKVEKMQINGQDCKTELDNTILKVWLHQPLLPGANVTFDVDFKTYFDMGGSIRRRMKMFNAYGNKHYDGVHWYPRLAAYDRKFGWSTDQHLGKEFYGNFGTYDVELTFAANYVLEATGYLMNRDEVLPKELREKLDIKNFAEKPWGSAPSIVTPYDPRQRKTWKFHAENVHDFAWTADPTYRIGETWWEDVQIVSLVQEPHASRWLNAADFTSKVIETYSRDFGRYIYNKMVVADARDGMEYPMITLNGGGDPGYRGLLAHEVGHNWFFGMVGSNETYRAALDEGFTQFLTAWALEKIDGPYLVKGKFVNKYTERHSHPELSRDARIYNGYLRDAVRLDQSTLNTHSDDFGGALRHGGGYGNVYYKTATMLHNLQYTLGDTLFQNAMKHYFNTWKIAHPYWEDFKNSIIQFTKVDLNWFFDQWFETSKTIDYKLGKVKRVKGENETYRIDFIRKGEMQMPIDFSVKAKDGKWHSFHIPNNWFEKETNAQVLPRWIGWGKLQPTYTAQVNIPSGIDLVQIDTTNRLADRYMLNNGTKFPMKTYFDAKIFNPPSWKNYELYVRPDLWYNAYDGVKLGFHTNGSFMNYLHRLDFNFWINTGFGKQMNFPERDINLNEPVSFRFRYEQPIDKVIRGLSYHVAARSLDGLRMAQAGFNYNSNSGNTNYHLYYKAMIRPDSSGLNYLLYTDEWAHGLFNNTMNVGLTHNYYYKRGRGEIYLNIRSSALGSDYDYAQATLQVVNYNRLGKFNLNTRAFAQWSSGLNLPFESSLFAAMGNPEAMMDDKFYRATGFFPNDWRGFGPNSNNLHFGGGLGLRGYSGYFIPYETSDGTILQAYRGHSGAAFNAELEFDRLMKFRPRGLRDYLKLNTYLFGDAGFLRSGYNFQLLSFSNFRMNAGVGTALTIKKFGPLQGVKPLILRFDMPLFLNRTPEVSPEFVQFRWVFGIGRAF